MPTLIYILRTLGFVPFNPGEKMMDDILAFVLQWSDTIVEWLNRIIAALEAFVKAPTPK